MYQLKLSVSKIHTKVPHLERKDLSKAQRDALFPHLVHAHDNSLQKIMPCPACQRKGQATLEVVAMTCFLS